MAIADKDIKVVPLDKVLNDWATISIDKFQEELVRKNIGEVDGNLMRSFIKQVEIANGDSWSVLIKFAKYGRFVDMGVGRGWKLGSSNVIRSGSGNRYEDKSVGRIAKKWYGKVKTREAAILHFIMKRNFNALAFKQLQTTLKKIEINIR